MNKPVLVPQLFLIFSVVFVNHTWKNLALTMHVDNLAFRKSIRKFLDYSYSDRGGMHWKEETALRVFVMKHEGKNHFENLGIVGSVRIK